MISLTEVENKPASHDGCQGTREGPWDGEISWICCQPRRSSDDIRGKGTIKKKVKGVRTMQVKSVLFSIPNEKVEIISQDNVKQCCPSPIANILVVSVCYAKRQGK
jgi:hypothetical protein